MGTIKLRSLEDIAHWHAELRVTCNRCGREARFEPRAMIRWFEIHRWSTALDIAPQRFRCSGINGAGCGSKDVRLSAIMPMGELPPTRPRPQPPDPANTPNGIDPVAWAAADERERKRLIRQAR